MSKDTSTLRMVFRLPTTMTWADLVALNPVLQAISDSDEKTLTAIGYEGLLFLIFMYDPGSEYVQQFNNSADRKRAVLKYLDIPADSSLAADLTDLSPRVREALMVLLRLINSRQWTIIVANEEMFYEGIESILKRVSLDEDEDKDIQTAIKMKTTILEQLDKINSRLTGLYAQFFTGDDELIETFQATEKVSPEIIAKRLRGEDV